MKNYCQNAGQEPSVLLDVFIMKNTLLYFIIHTFQTILERNNAVKIRKIGFIFKKFWCLESHPQKPNNWFQFNL